MITTQKALEKLQMGNQQFIDGKPADVSADYSFGQSTQAPFAIILSCSDSRVPPEVVFNQGVGDLFVIRVAGNIATPSQIGSVEYAATQFGTPLVVVMGHSHCGAIQATLDCMRDAKTSVSENIYAIVSSIQPTLQPLFDDQKDDIGPSFEQRATRANVLASIEQLRLGSSILDQLCDDNRLKMVGAEYSLETGQVDFFTEA